MTIKNTPTFEVYFPISTPTINLNLSGMQLRNRIPMNIFRWFDRRGIQCGSFNLERNELDILIFSVFL